MRQLLSIIGILLISCALSECTLTREEPLVARVGTISITLKELQNTIQNDYHHLDFKPIKIESLKPRIDEILSEMIDDTILLHAALKQKVSISDTELDQAIASLKSSMDEDRFTHMLETRNIAYHDWRRNFRESLIRNKYVNMHLLTQIPISEDEIAQYYKEHIHDFTTKKATRMRHILLNDKKTAERVHAQLDEGANFALLAKEFSSAPERDRGGDLGYITGDSYPAVFTRYMQKGIKGVHSPIITSPYGYHIFKIIDERPSHTLDLSEAHATIARILQEKKLASFYKEWLEEERQKTQITLYPNHIDLLTKERDYHS
jgi:parvulin-like peptidyl-prolyl isomerase